MRVELLVFLLQCHLVFCVCVQSFIVVILYEQQRIILIEFIRFCYQSFFLLLLKFRLENQRKCVVFGYKLQGISSDIRLTLSPLEYVLIVQWTKFKMHTKPFCCFFCINRLKRIQWCIIQIIATRKNWSTFQAEKKPKMAFSPQASKKC